MYSSDHSSSRLPLRVAIELLSGRVGQLCQFITESGLQPPQLPPEKDEALKRILESLGHINESKSIISLPNELETKKSSEIHGSYDGRLPEMSANHIVPNNSASIAPCSDRLAEGMSDTGVHNISSSPLCAHNIPFDFPFGEATTNIAQGSPNSVLSSWDLDLGFMTCINPTANGAQYLSGSPQGATAIEQDGFVNFLEPTVHDDDETLAEETGSSEDIEKLIDEVSDRVGTIRIGPGGKTQFCGPTSTFNLTGTMESEESELQSINEAYASEYYDRSGSNQEIPSTLEEHLINLYFCWQDPFCHIVDRNMYSEARRKWQDMEDTPFYSEALRYVMCVVGSAFESRFHPALVTFPKSLVDFLGTRVKSILELELDDPCVATVQALVILSNHEIGNGKGRRGGDITSADAELRRTVFWAAYTADHQLGFNLGRPSRTSMEDVTVRKPQGQVGQSEHYRWVPYEVQGDINSTTGLLDCTEAVSQQMVSLCELMVPCGYILYGTSRISKPVLQELNAKIVAQLHMWKSNLPPFLQINLDDYTSAYLPHVLLLHMQYHQNIIYAHRPWMSKNGLQPNPPKGPGYLHAREMCISSAIAISKILVLYETRYTLRRINVKAVSITSSAILLLLFAAVTKYPPHPQSEIKQYLNSCFRALDDFSLSWQSARRAKDLLVNLQHQWEIRTKSRKDIKNLEKIIYLPRKRPRGSSRVYRVMPVGREAFACRRYEPEMDIYVGTEPGLMPMNDSRSGLDNRNKDSFDIAPGCGLDAP
ncbi:hypothetical protein N7462_006806 [Penicillium macrosclerotiorum]|uniref:uncharacterized protein n=1 Tax=Penicillium macrosclerotiorum TaxID=303699 RepID=UPI002547C4CF|nr:uncharacterized protein N7462_006806 [Penicillium macrosclerotiorum]KAJ5683641.1 hypothetical protein N7462_006806 [Penicillium macrosclerotiorum]